MELNFTYPKSAGWKEATTGREAADAIEGSGRASVLRQRVLDAFQDFGDMTADECAAILTVDRIAIRPRCSELHKQGLLIDTGVRRSNESGASAKVWRLK